MTNQSPSDHDLLIRIDEKLNFLATNIEAQRIALAEHITHDEKREELVHARVNRNTSWINRIVGAMSVSLTGLGGWQIWDVFK